MDELDLGKSSGYLQDGSISLNLNNASARVSGSYEAYTFWTTYGNLTLDIAGSLHLDVKVGVNNTLNMTSCTANYTKVDLDLQMFAVLQENKSLNKYYKMFTAQMTVIKAK